MEKGNDNCIEREEENSEEKESSIEREWGNCMKKIDILIKG